MLRVLNGQVGGHRQSEGRLLHFIPYIELTEKNQGWKWRELQATGILPLLANHQAGRWQSQQYQAARRQAVAKSTRDRRGPRNQQSEGGEAPSHQGIKAQPALCQNSRVRQSHRRTVNSLIDVLRTFVNGLLFVKGLEQDQNPQSH